MNNGARLPFPRGQTAAGLPQIYIASPTGGAPISQIPTTLGLLTQTNAFRPDLAGIDVVETTDTVVGTSSTSVGAGTPSKRPMKLRAVQNAGTAFTPGPYCVTFGTAPGQFGFVTTSPAIPTAGNGLAGKPIDPAYFWVNGAYVTPANQIAQWDWFYVVWEGPAILCVGTALPDYQQAVAMNNTGQAIPATAGLSVIGEAENIQNSTGTTKYVIVYVEPGLRVSES